MYCLYCIYRSTIYPSTPSYASSRLYLAMAFSGSAKIMNGQEYIWLPGIFSWGAFVTLSTINKQHGTGVQKLHCRRPWVIDLLDFCDLSKAPKISAALRRQSTLSVQACPTFMAEVYSIEDQFTNRGSPSSVYFSKLYCSVKMSSCPKPPLQIPLNLVARGLWMLLRKPLQYCTLCTVLDEVLIRVMKCKHSMYTRSFAKKELDCLLIP